LATSKPLSLREVEQLFSKINLVFLSTDENIHIHPPLLVFLLFAKEFHADIYQNYIQETSTPDGIIELLYKMIPESERFGPFKFECSLIESFLIASKSNRFENYSGNSLLTHKNIAANADTTDLSKSYSENVIRIAESLIQDRYSVNLSGLVKRIEMLEQFKFGSDKN
jgi:hypothetical protein